MQQSAFYYDEHAGQYRNSRTIDTEPWFGFISSGTAIAYHNSPMYEYLQLLKENKVAPHSYINDYYSYFSKARDGEYKYENLRVVFGGYYELYKPIVDKYNKLHNTYKKIFGKKIYYLQPLAYLLKPIMSVFERALNLLFKKIIEAESKWKDNDNKAKTKFYTIHAKLSELQSLKINMMQAKANIARYTEIESVDDAASAGAFVYYNPKTRQKVVVQKPTLKGALKEIATKYGIALKESDLEYMVVQEKGGDYVNVTRFTGQIKKTDENGYETDELMQVYHAGTVSQTYANIMNTQRLSSLTRYITYTKSMYTDKGYDRVVIDRAVERELYKQYAEDEQSALRIGAESKGTIRAMIAYMGYLEGMPSEVIQELDALVDGDNSNALSTQFGQYVKQYEGINDRELSQRRSLQVHQWQITKKLLQDKKDDWDRIVNRIFERGMRQWNMMLQAFANRWRNWQSDAKETIVAGNKKWDERMKQLEQAKLQWFADAYSGMSAREIHVRLSNLEVTVNQLLSHMKETYGVALATIDVHALLLEVLKDQPELLSEEVLQLAKTKVAFGLTQLTTRKYNKTICNEAQQLVDAFVLEQQRTHNLQLLKALTELLKRCREQLKAANEQAKNAAEQFVSAYGFMVQGDSYWRKLSVYEKKQVIGAFRPFVYDDSLILGTYNIPGLMQLYQRDDGVQFGATMQVVLTQVQTRMGMLLMPDVPWGFSSYVGEFGQIVYDGGSPKLEKEGKGEYRRIRKRGV